MVEPATPESTFPRTRPFGLVRGSLACLVVLFAGIGARSASAIDAPRVNALIKGAALIVRAHVDEVTEYDNGRVVVASLRVSQVLKGAPPKGNVSVIEMRDLPLPPLFETGRDMVAFLTVATRNSYLAQHTPTGDYMSPVKVKPSVLTARSEADAEALTKLVSSVMPGQPVERDRAKRLASDRSLTFSLIAASHPVLVEDGVTSINRIDNLASTLSADEQGVLETAIERSDLPTRLRVTILQTVGNLGLKQLIPRVRRVENPELVDTAWQTLTKLGAAPDREEMQKQLASGNAGLRSAAIQQLLREDKAAAIPQAEKISKTDPDTNVRVAAVEAIGRTGVPEAVPALEKIYAEPMWETRQAVGRALIGIGGRTAADAFDRMAFNAPPDAQRYAVVLLMLVVPRDDALLQHIKTSHPDPALRDLAEHGVEAHHH